MSSPKQVSQTLNIPPSTLRRWSNQFSEYLSPHEKGIHRDYTISDIATLKKIRDLLDQGLRYDDIKDQIAVLDQSSDQNFAIQLIGDYTEALADIQAIMQAQNTKIKNQDQRIKALEAWIALPWYRKMFTKPPDFSDPTSD